MTDLVPEADIERIVGVTRSLGQHIGRAVTRGDHLRKKDTFYILHSKQCLREHEDLKRCPFSRALDKGIQPEWWIAVEDKPVYIGINHDFRVVPLFGQASVVGEIGMD